MFCNKVAFPTDVSVITTYRCQMHCKMCNIWQNPTKPEEEICPRDLEILPSLKFANVTGGEPFLREDLQEIIEVLYKKSKRVVISTSGYYTEKVLTLARKFPNIGIRVSIEGLESTNNHLRGRDDGFEKGLLTLRELRGLGLKDIGFGQTISGYNSQDIVPLYELAKTMNLEFATAAFHNSFYFHKQDNLIDDKEEVCANIARLIDKLLQESHPKAWFRAFFNMGLINYIQGNRRPLPCEAGTVNFFIEPNGDVYPCNGLEEKYWKESMGNIHETRNFEEIWFSEQAEKVRAKVRICPKNCWMVGTAAPVMKKYLTKVVPWVSKAKINSLLGHSVDYSYCQIFNVGQDPRQGNLRKLM